MRHLLFVSLNALAGDGWLGPVFTVSWDELASEAERCQEARAVTPRWGQTDLRLVAGPASRLTLAGQGLRH